MGPIITFSYFVISLLVLFFYRFPLFFRFLLSERFPLAIQPFFFFRQNENANRDGFVFFLFFSYFRGYVFATRVIIVIKKHSVEEQHGERRSSQNIHSRKLEWEREREISCIASSWKFQNKILPAPSPLCLAPSTTTSTSLAHTVKEDWSIYLGTDRLVPCNVSTWRPKHTPLSLPDQYWPPFSAAAPESTGRCWLPDARERRGDWVRL